METSLHRQLKELYAGQTHETEVRLGKFRIDVVRGGELVEIQHGSLAAIRDKVRALCQSHRVLVVKPIVARKTIVKLSAKGHETSRRRSPKRCTPLEVFADLVYFTRSFPHLNLVLEILLVEIEETRTPGHGRRRRWRRDDHIAVDQKLIAIDQSVRLRTAADLLTLLPPLASPFDSADLAKAAGVPRPIAQRIAYCLREMGAIRTRGKRGNTLLYEISATPKKRARRAA